MLKISSDNEFTMKSSSIVTFSSSIVISGFNELPVVYSYDFSKLPVEDHRIYLEYICSLHNTTKKETYTQKNNISNIDKIINILSKKINNILNK